MTQAGNTWALRAGTTWAAPGTGSTVQELVEATRDDGGGSLSTDHGKRLFVLTQRCGPAYVTNLRLTGQKLTYYDLRRIAAAK